MAETRLLSKRGCGYPTPGGVYLESIGSPGGTLPLIVVLDPPIPHDHFHRGWVYIDLDAMLAEHQVQYVGASVQSAGEWHLRQKYQGVVRDVFGPNARIKDGQVLKFRDAAARLLQATGWQPGGLAHTLQAIQILRDHATDLAAYIELKTPKPSPGSTCLAARLK
jgi:hypothetical protein